MLKYAKGNARLVSEDSFDVRSPHFRIYDTKDEFDFGNCATIAIAMAFSQAYKTVKAMFRLAKINCENGITSAQCTLMINTLSIIKDKNIETKNMLRRKMTVAEFISKNQKGTYLVAVEKHMFYMYNGAIIDGFYYSWPYDIFIHKVERYWKIENKPKQQRIKSPITWTGGIAYFDWNR